MGADHQQGLGFGFGHRRSRTGLNGSQATIGGAVPRATACAPRSLRGLRRAVPHRRRDQHVAVHQRAGGAQQRRALDRRGIDSGGASAAPRRPSSTVNSPVGCSTDSRRRDPLPGRATARRGGAGDDAGGGDRHRAQHADRLVADPGDERARGDRAAVARRRHQRHLGHDAVADVAQVHQRAGGEPDRLQPRLELGVRVERLAASRSRCARGGAASITTTGMPLSMQVTADPVDRRRARCRSAAARRRLEPAVSTKVSMAIGAAAPGTPSMRAVAARSRPRRPASATRASQRLAGVDHADAHASSRRRSPRTRPRSMANGPTPARMLPQFGAASTRASSTTDLREQVVDVAVRPRRAARRSRPCWSADARRRCRRSGAGRASPTRPAARGRASPRRPAGPRPGNRRPSTCRRASACSEWRSGATWCLLGSSISAGEGVVRRGALGAGAARAANAAGRHALHPGCPGVGRGICYPRPVPPRALRGAGR